MINAFKRLSATFLSVLPVCALLIGVAIYVFARPEDPAAFHWARSIGLGNLLDAFRPGSSYPVIILPAWIVYSLPNALWALAYAVLITRIWAGSRQIIGLFWMATIPLLILGMELLQYWSILPGTFALADLIAGILGMSAGYFIGIISKK